MMGLYLLLLSMKKPKNIINPVLIGIAGPSGSGKTTLVRKIFEYIGHDKCTVIPVDNYYYDLSHLSDDEKKRHNYDHPDAIDFKTLINDLLKLKATGEISIPIYDFKTHERMKHSEKIKAKEIIIIEGILLFAKETLNKIIELKIYLDTPIDICLIRRVKRDLNERNRTIESVYNQYVESVRPMYFKFVKKSKKNADLILKNDVLDISKLIIKINKFQKMKD